MSHNTSKVVWILTSLVLFCFGGCLENRKGDERLPTRTESQLHKLDSGLLSTIAALHYANDEFDSALLIYQKLSKMDSSVGMYQFRTGYCLLQLDQPLLAVQHYDASINLNYRVFDANKTLGLIYAVPLRNKKKALEYWAECLKLRPGDPEIQKLISSLASESGGANL